MDTRTGGVWVTYFFDGPPRFNSAFETEIEALRKAVENNEQVIFVPFGIDFGEAVKAAEDKKKDR